MYSHQDRIRAVVLFIKLGRRARPTIRKSGSRKQRRTVKQTYVDLQALGYGGSYNRVAALARLWHEQRLAGY